MDFAHNKYSFPSHTGNTDIFVQCIAPADCNEVKGIIQLVHGMAEHTDRYLDVAKYMAEKGFAFIMHDQAGHGRSVKSDDDNGYFCDKDGYKRLTEDVKSVTELAKKLYPGKKLVIWGHSMGSFITRYYLSLYGGAADAAVICGTAGKNPAAGAGIMVANLFCKLKGTHCRSKFIDNLAFGSYNKKFNGTTGFEWLSQNEENVQKYVADPKCGFLFTASAFRDLFSVLNEVNTDKWYTSVPKNMPLFLIAGEMDPVGNYTKGVYEVYDKLTQTGHNAKIKIYPEMRHEIHNEKNNTEVYSDIADFAESIL